MNIEQMRERLVVLNERCQTILALAEAEKRDLNDDERKELDAATSEYDVVQNDVAAANRVINQTADLNRSVGRVSDPTPIAAARPADAGHEVARIESAREPGGAWGWRHFGEFAQAVQRAGLPQGATDPRFLTAAATTWGGEDVGADGGFAVPPDFRAGIQVKIQAEDNLIGRTDQQLSSSNTFNAPIDETTPWGSTGIQAAWEGEANASNQTKPALQPMALRLHKLKVLVPVTDELLDDAPGMENYLMRKAPEFINFKLNLGIVQGTGVGQILGILNSPALVTVAKETGQAADTIVGENIVKMWSRMYSPSRPTSAWLINQDIEPQLHTMSLPIGTGGVPLYLPAGGFSGSPFSMLYGRPVVPTQANETLGDLGDIIFADLNQYLTVQKPGGIRASVSMHLWFDQDIMAFRFILRVAGRPWLSTSIAARDGSTTYSPFVALAERA